jgi:hypothetical protein
VARDDVKHRLLVFDIHNRVRNLDDKHPKTVFVIPNSTMRGKTITFQTVRDIGLQMPEVEESTMYGAPALKLRGQLLTCLPTHKSAEPNSLAVRVSFADRDDLLREAPEIYYVKEHYLGYPVVLVRLSRIKVDELRDLLATSLRFVNSKLERRKKTRRAART